MTHSKTFFTGLLATLSAMAATAQSVALDVQYVNTLKAPKMLDQIEDIATRQATMDYFQNYKETFSLYYNGTDVTFCSGEKTDTAEIDVAKQAKHYMNLGSRETLETKSLADKEFVIRGTMLDIDWDIDTEKSKSILGKQCYRATAGPDTAQTVAWFCPEIAAPVGPMGTNGTPGLILKLSTPGADYEATQIETTRPDIPIKLPKEKDTVTAEEYKKAESRFLTSIGGEDDGGIQVIEL